MKRRDFVASLPMVATVPRLWDGSRSARGVEERPRGRSGPDDRQYWVGMLVKLADPVLTALAANRLRATMPVEVGPEGDAGDRGMYTHLEAVGRLLAGMAPWLELEPDASEEGRLRAKYLDLALRGLANGLDPAAPDALNFNQSGPQSLVDAAFLAHALLRAPRQLYARLDRTTQERLVAALQSTRQFEPALNNWVLFSAIIEAALLHFTGRHEQKAIDHALARMEEWYKGSGVYGDGAAFAWDYYNSYVIHPMLLDIYRVLVAKRLASDDDYATELGRAQKYASVQEHFISPEGTFPLIGRSSTYRIGAFQTLAQLASTQQLPDSLRPAQVRCALTAVMKRSLDAPRTFDSKGWLQIGFCGHQPQLADPYISTGSLYLTAAAFLPLGLPPGDQFWAAPAADWSSRKAYQGVDEAALPW